MFSSRIIDVAIGLAFTFLLYSLLATTVWEMVAIFFDLRAKTLMKGIRHMLTDTHQLTWGGLLKTIRNYKFPESKETNGALTISKERPLWQKFYAHPIIKNYGEGRLINKYPSYLPTDNFSSILVDILKAELPWYYGVKATRELNEEKIKIALVENNVPTSAVTQTVIGTIRKALADTDRLKALLAEAQMNNDDTRQSITTVLTSEPRNKAVIATELSKKGILEIETKQGLVDQIYSCLADIDAIEKALESLGISDTDSRHAIAQELAVILPDAAIAARALKLQTADASPINQLKKMIEYAKENDTFIPKETACILQMMLAQAAVKANQVLDEAYSAQSAQNGTAQAPTDSLREAQIIDQFRLLLNKWFDDTMVRVSSWYKRRTQYGLMALGMLLAIFFNIDTIQITSTLSVDKDARKQITDMATAYMGSHKDPPTGTTAFRIPEDTTHAAGNNKKYDSLVDYAQNLLKGDIAKSNKVLYMGYNGFGLNDRTFTDRYIANCWLFKNALRDYARDSLMSLREGRELLDTVTRNLMIVDSLLCRNKNDEVCDIYDQWSSVQKRNKESIQKIGRKISDLVLVSDYDSAAFFKQVARLDTMLIPSAYLHTNQDTLTSPSKNMTGTALRFRPFGDARAQRRFDSINLTLLHGRDSLSYLNTIKTQLGILTLNRNRLLHENALLNVYLRVDSQCNILNSIRMTEHLEEIADGKDLDAKKRLARAAFTSTRQLLHTEVDSLTDRSIFLGIYADELVRRSALATLYESDGLIFVCVSRLFYVWYLIWGSTKLIGFLITAFAISLGSPFWFDLLNKFMQLRSAMKSDDTKK